MTSFKLISNVPIKLRRQGEGRKLLILLVLNAKKNIAKIEF